MVYKKKETIYVCENCGNETLRWQGKCPFCGNWNTLKEVEVSQNKEQFFRQKQAQVINLGKIEAVNFKPISTKIGEVDRVLGAGIIPGSIILLGGDPGIGKSTLLLQIASSLSNVLYVSGEESAQQIKIRFDRLELKNDNLQFLAETDVETIIKTIEKIKPEIVIIDSIQTMFDANFPSTPGSIVQSASALSDFNN